MKGVHRYNVHDRENIMLLWNRQIVTPFFNLICSFCPNSFFFLCISVYVCVHVSVWQEQTQWPGTPTRCWWLVCSVLLCCYRIPRFASSVIIRHKSFFYVLKYLTSVYLCSLLRICWSSATVPTPHISSSKTNSTIWIWTSGISRCSAAARLTAWSCGWCGKPLALLALKNV